MSSLTPSLPITRGQFWVNFIIGDDWTVAASLAAALLCTWGLTRAGLPAWWLIPIAAIDSTVLNLRRAALMR